MPKVSTRFGRRHKPCSICRKKHPVWWNSSKGRWFLSVEKDDGGFRQVNLGPDHDEAIAKWHRIEAGIESVETPATAVAFTGTGEGLLIGDLVDGFLASLRTKIELGELTEKRYKTSRRFLLRFVKHFGGSPVGSLRIGGVDRINDWLKNQKTWARCRADVVSRIRQLFNWGTKSGHVASPSPIAALEKPKFNIRVTTFSPEQIEAILSVANDFFARGFRMLLLTGCRPDEICSLGRESVKEDASGFYLLVTHKNQRHTGKPRRVYLVPEAQQIIREQMATYPSGRLFRSANKTSDGVRPPMSPEYFGHALRDICKKPSCDKLGLNDFDVIGKTKDGKPKRQYHYVAYTTRHTFAVRYLTGFYKDPTGKPIILSYGEVAALLGNTAKMVEQIYGHLCDQTSFLTARLFGTFGA